MAVDRKLPGNSCGLVRVGCADGMELFPRLVPVFEGALDVMDEPGVVGGAECSCGSLCV